MGFGPLLPDLLSGNSIVWTGSDLVALNSGGATLAAGGTLTMTVQVQFSANFFDEETVCTRLVDNTVVARSTSPDYTTPPSPVQVTVNNPDCETAPVPTSLPNTGFETGSTSLFVPLGSVAAFIIGLILLKIFAPWRKLNTAGTGSRIEELRNKMRRPRK